MPVLKKKVDEPKKQQLGKYKDDDKSYTPVLMHPDMRGAFFDRNILVFLFTTGSFPRGTYWTLHGRQLPPTILYLRKRARRRWHLVLNGKQLYLESKVGYGRLQLGIER